MDDTRSVADGDLDCIEEDLEQQETLLGYKSGFQMGQKDGQDEGFTKGMEEGKTRGSEVGYYRGFAVAWIHMLQLKPTPFPDRCMKAMSKLKEIMKLAESFPTTNESISEEKISEMRLHFNQSTLLLNI